MNRIDRILVERGLCRSRSQAQELISQKKVLVRQAGAWVVVSRPSQKASQNDELRIEENDLQRFVSRGGVKLQGALAHCRLSVYDLTVLDIGQSTGGFTDCLLQQGVRKIIGIEVGHDQIAECLKRDSRVVTLEGVNARALPESLLNLTPNQMGFDLIVMDLSFISQQLITANMSRFLKPDGTALCLVKPQFEAGPDKLGKGGIIKDERVYAEVEDAVKSCYENNGFNVLDYFPSPITGADGNREFFIYAGINS